MAKKKRKGSKQGGKYVGLLNAVDRSAKAKARKIQKARGFGPAIKFLLKKRRSSKGRKRR